MPGKLAVVTGLGKLSDEVVRLADALPERYIRYTIRPWLPLITRPIATLDIFYLFHERRQSLNPFRFEELERRLKADNIDRAFLVGDFPWDRFWQIKASKAGGSRLGNLVINADTKFRNCYEGIDDSLSEPAKYFVAIETLMRENDVRPLSSREIFPSLNIPAGCVSIAAPPDDVRDHFCSLALSLRPSSSRSTYERIRPSQAAIVDRATIKLREVLGTKHLLRRYARDTSAKEFPYLLKIPSPDFNSALDEPVIGPETVDDCRAAGVRGIVICADATRVIARELTIEKVNSYGMFLYGVPASELVQRGLRPELST